MNKQKKRGQPPKDAAQKCNDPLSVYLTLEERQKIDAIASKELLSASKFVRIKLKEIGII